MNCLLHTLQSFPWAYFFDDTGKIHETVVFSGSSGFIDTLSASIFFEKTTSLFYISGPANFTALRNLSVFLQIFKNFSSDTFSFYSVPTLKALSFLFPEFSSYVFPVGKRESFLMTKESFVKYKNDDLPTGDFAFFSDQIIFSESFFLTLLAQKELFFTNTIMIEYGAEPVIGTKG